MTDVSMRKSGSRKEAIKVIQIKKEKEKKKQ